MENRYLFRGKRKDNSEWVEGFYVRDSQLGRHFIMQSTVYHATEIIPETVGQFTGMKDAKDRKIFEGDKCSYTTRDGSVFGTVVWEQQACAFWFKWHDGAASRYKKIEANYGDELKLMCQWIEVIPNPYPTRNDAKGGEK